MALSKNYNFEVCGKTIEFDNSYIEIKDISGTKENIIIHVNIYDSSSKENIIVDKYYSYTPDFSDTSLNNFKQGYEYLKTLDEYKDATDVLEVSQTTTQ